MNGPTWLVHVPSRFGQSIPKHPKAPCLKRTSKHPKVSNPKLDGGHRPEKPIIPLPRHGLSGTVILADIGVVEKGSMIVYTWSVWFMTIMHGTWLLQIPYQIPLCFFEGASLGFLSPFRGWSSFC